MGKLLTRHLFFNVKNTKTKEKIREMSNHKKRYRRNAPSKIISYFQEGKGTREGNSNTLFCAIFYNEMYFCTFCIIKNKHKSNNA